MRSIFSNYFSKPDFLCFVMLSAIVFNSTMAGERHDNRHEENTEHMHQNNEEGVVLMSDTMMQATGVIAGPVEGGTIRQTTRLYGRIVTDPASLSHIRARFDGMIIKASVNIGDRVKKGDALATIESNESLKRYTITAPFDGEVIARHASTGELSNGQILFSIANFDRVWAELALFPSQINTIKKGQDVTLAYASTTQPSTISHITAITDKSAHSAVFVPLDNTDGQWPVGTLVEAQVTTSLFDVRLRVPCSSLQSFDNETVVFVKKGGEFHAEPVETGRRDDAYVEIINGLSPGDTVAIENSFLLKADLEKSEADHDH